MNKIALLTREGSDGPEVFFVSESATMGSSAACDVAVKSAAPQHCRVVRSDEGFLVRDLTGQGLIKLNGKSTFAALLQEGDLLEIGRDSFKFSEGFETEPEESAKITDRPPSKGTHRIPRSAPRSGKPKGAVPAVRDSLASPQAPRRRIPLVPLAVAGGIVLGILALFLVLPKSRMERTKSPGFTSMGASPPQTTSSRRPKDSDVTVRTPVLSPSEAPAPRTSNSEAAPQAPTELRRSPAAGAAGSDSSSFVVPHFSESASTAPMSHTGLDQFLKDPGRRALPEVRASLARSLRAASLDSEVLRAAAMALGWTTNAWDLNSSQAQVWSAYAKGTSFETLELLSAADHVARARMLLEGGKAPVLRLFALAHLLEALSGDPSVSGLLDSSGYYRSVDGKRWGEFDGISQYKITQYYFDRSREDPSLENKAVASPDFGTRYAGLLLEIDRSLRRGAGIQATWRDLATSGVPETLTGGSAHLRALAESYRKAVTCKECKNGRVPCPQCQGKGRVDAPCPACKGEGRIMAPGAVNGAQVSQRCNACDGHKIFKQVGCPACARTGTVGCSSCGGDPWRERNCTNPNCRDGWVRCQTCRGGGRVDVSCPDCNGTGRVTAPGSAVGALVTQKCRTCNEDHGVFKRLAKCQTCGGNGLTKCGSCEGKASNQKSAVALISEVFSTEPCAECKGSGWPSPRMAIPCVRCLGLGVRIKPAIDPSKTLE
jgi:DnaJ-class molecular chaperone